MKLLVIGDAVCLVAGRPEHDSLLLEMQPAIDRRERINRAMDFALATVARLAVPPGSCVLCGPYPAGSLVRETNVAGLGNL
jgi:hypothetical protein